MSPQTPPTAAVPRPRGRPRDPARLERVLVAAKKQFNELGFERASVDAIAEASGVSKVTIYKYFPTKADLFQASVAHRIDADFGTLDWHALDPRKPRDALTRVGRTFLALMRSPEVINTHRTLYGAKCTEPTAAQGFYAAGPEALVGAVAGYLRAADAAGSLKVRDPATAADQFLSLFLGLAHIRGLLGIEVEAARGYRDDEARLKANVDLMLKAFGRS